VDRLTRKELKTDKFAREVGHSVEYVTEHRKQFTRIAGIALAAVALAVAVYAFVQYRKGARQDELRAALRIQEAAVGQPANEGLLSYQTQDEKNKAMVKAFTDFVNKYDGTDEAAVAHYYLAATAADKGNLGEAEKQFRAVADSGNKNYASLAKLSLANIYQSQGKQSEGENLLRSLVDKPTSFVSKEQATIALARYVAAKNPAEARKMLEPLRTERGPVSRTALTALSEIPQK
jgi:predicted negative regulator of RcsB-dependent stress response